jgi:flagellin-like hook-associated protein FlgL
MSDISLSKAVRSNLLALQGTADMMAVAQNRLSTGNKVNSALDNPSNWFTAKGLSNRSSDLNALMDSMANGIQTLKAADNGLSAMTKTLESMQSTLRQARQDKSFNTESLTLADINANDPALGKLTLSGGAVANSVDVDLIKTGTGDIASTTLKYDPPTAATPASIEGDATFVAATAQAATALTFTFGGKTATISIPVDAGNTRTVDEFTALVQEQIEDSALSGLVTFTDSAPGAGKFTIAAVNNVDGDITIGGAQANAVFGTVAADPDNIVAGERTPTTGSDGKHDFTINGKKITLTPTSGADVDAAVASINTQLGSDKTFEAYREIGGKLAFRAIRDDAGSLKIGGADAGLFGTPTNGIVSGTSSSTLSFARTVDELVVAVNANTNLVGKVRASNDNGKLRLENQSTTDLVIEGKNTTSGKLDGTTGTSTVKGNAVRTGLASQFNELRDQLDKLADDASFNGINLMRGDNLTITFNETGTSSIDIHTKDSKTINSANLGVPTSLNANQLDSDTTIDGLLDDMKAALNEVRSQASTFGSNLSIVQNRQDFTRAMIDTLETGAGNLTLADMNEEAANLLALQTRQQLSSNSLSLASQADQSVLQLLR